MSCNRIRNWCSTIWYGQSLAQKKARVIDHMTNIIVSEPSQILSFYTLHSLLFFHVLQDLFGQDGHEVYDYMLMIRIGNTI